MTDASEHPSPPSAAAILARDFNWRIVVFSATLLLVLITLQPFIDRSAIATISVGSLDTTYPIIELLLLAASLVLCVPLVRVALPSLVRTFSVLLILWLVVAVATSQNVDLSFRRLLVALLEIGLAAAVLLVPKTLEEFSGALIAAVAGVLVLCYLSVLIVPNLTIHQMTDALEPELDGNWRGLYFHKNTAGMMMGIFVFVGLFAIRMEWRMVGAFIIGAALPFLLLTRSKNAIALLVLVYAVAAAAQRVKSWRWRALICVLPLILLNVFTVGTVFFEPLKHFVDLLGIDSTFTGRSDIWSFVTDRIKERPITGYGLRAFWNTSAAFAAGEHDQDWLWRAGSSHNAYLDLALTIGIPGTVLMTIVVVIYPLVDYQRRLREPANELLAGLFFPIWLFLLYSTALESLFLDRSPTWFMLVFSIFGLRYLSVFRVNSASRQPAVTAGGTAARR